MAGIAIMNASDKLKKLEDKFIEHVRNHKIHLNTIYGMMLETKLGGIVNDRNVELPSSEEIEEIYVKYFEINEEVGKLKNKTKIFIKAIAHQRTQV